MTGADPKQIRVLILGASLRTDSLPGILKKLIDWVSRLRPRPFNGKRGLLVSASPSMIGDNRGLWSLRVPPGPPGARLYPDMFSLAQAHQALADGGRLANDMLQKRFDDTIRCFLDLVEAAKHHPTLKKQWVEFSASSRAPRTDRVERSEVTAA